MLSLLLRKHLSRIFLKTYFHSVLIISELVDNLALNGQRLVKSNLKLDLIRIAILLATLMEDRNTALTKLNLFDFPALCQFYLMRDVYDIF